MANDVGEGFGCLSFIVIAVALWWWFSTPLSWWSDKNTVFLAVCSESYKNDDCPDLEVPFASFTFRVNRNTSEVAWLLKTFDETTMGVKEDCSIFDEENWSCPSGDVRQMLEGELILSKQTTDKRVVSRWRYKYLQAKGWRGHLKEWGRQVKEWVD